MPVQALKVWAGRTLRLRFARRAEYLEANLLGKRPAVHAALQQAHWLCLHLSAAAVPQRLHVSQQQRVQTPRAGDSLAGRQNRPELQAPAPAVSSSTVISAGADAGGGAGVGASSEAGLSCSLAAVAHSSEPEAE